MENQPTVRVRFAPSPTGGLHLGGVRTVLYNYLFAKKNNGKFILRIEDTDQTRYVDGAEQYIYDCLQWCGMEPDESPLIGGPHAPYRQSERKAMYREYALKLIDAGKAYYAFDTPEELEQMREKLKSEGSASLQYDHNVRLKMKNSLSLSAEETQAFLQSGKPYVIRIKVEPGEILKLEDLVRGTIEMDTTFVDDKVLLKADGMPTYHLAVVVDDYLMQITHAFRGEEWLPSAPVHVLLWKYLFGLDKMPHWAHLPLILKPDGNGKLSKRDGERLGFPVYAMNWTDPATSHTTIGFRETGFLPEAFINVLAMLGWHDGTQQEVYSMEELIEKFSLDRVHKVGAKFDYEKAKWFNHQWILKLNATHYADTVAKFMQDAGIHVQVDAYFIKVLDAVKERCHLLTDFTEHAGYFFKNPTEIDLASIQPKWNDEKVSFFNVVLNYLSQADYASPEKMEAEVKELATVHNIKFGEIQMILRIMLVGKKAGIGVFPIVSFIGKETATHRIQHVLNLLEVNQSA